MQASTGTYTNTSLILEIQSPSAIDTLHYLQQTHAAVSSFANSESPYDSNLEAKIIKYAKEILSVAPKLEDHLNIDLARQILSQIKKISVQNPNWQYGIYPLKNNPYTNISSAEKELFKADLKMWVKRHSADIHYNLYSLAADRIEKAFLDGRGSLYPKKTIILDLSGLQLEDLPDCIGLCINLEELNVANNSLRSLPKALGQCKHLKKLNAEYNQLESLPETGCIDLCTDLEELNVANNKLRSLPNNLGQCKYLRVLHVEHNQLESLPDTISQCRKLEELSLNHNKLAILPSALFECRTLLKLSLTHNLLTSLSSKIAQLVLIQLLDLSYNQDLNELPKEMGQLSQLTDLRTSGTQIHPDVYSEIWSQLQASHLNFNLFVEELKQWFESYSSPWFKEYPSRGESCIQRLLEAFFIGELNLSDLKLTEIPNCLSRCKGLKTFDVYDNELTEIPAFVSQFKDLQSFNIGKNRIQTLPDLSACTQLKQLGLRNNNFKSLPSYVYQLSQLESLDVSGNPELEELPMSLSQLPSLVDAFIYDTKIEDDLFYAIRDVRRHDKLNICKGSLESRLKVWKAFGKSEVNFTEMIQLKDYEELNTIDQGLVRLQRINFPPHSDELQEILAHIICEMIALSLTDSIFKQTFLTYFQQLSQDSDDSIPFTLKELCQAWQITLVNSGSSSKKSWDSIKSLFEQANPLEFVARENEVKKDDLEALNEDLNAWINDPAAKGDKQGAASKIKDVFIHQQLSLQLARYNLNTLPSCIGKLTWLKSLGLSRNELNTIPDSLQHLKNLWFLDLEHNKLSELPASLNQCLNLADLRLKHNQFKFVPTFLGHLPRLTSLDLKHNPELNTLPLSFIEMPNIINLTLDPGTKIENRIARTITNFRYARQKLQVKHPLFYRLLMWQECGKNKADLTNIHKLSDIEKELINQWLMHLERAQSFKEKTLTQTELAKNGCEILQRVAHDENFQKMFLEQLSHHTQDEVSAITFFVSFLS